MSINSQQSSDSDVDDLFANLSPKIRDKMKSRSPATCVVDVTESNVRGQEIDLTQESKKLFPSSKPSTIEIRDNDSLCLSYVSSSISEIEVLSVTDHFNSSAPVQGKPQGFGTPSAQGTGKPSTRARSSKKEISLCQVLGISETTSTYEETGLPKTIHVHQATSSIQRKGLPKESGLPSLSPNPNEAGCALGLPKESGLPSLSQDSDDSLCLEACFPDVDQCVLASTQSMKHKEVQKSIDSHLNLLKQPWHGEIMFEMFIDGKLELIDICTVIQEKLLSPLLRIYFNPDVYPVEDGFDGEVFKKLCKDICSRAIDNGFMLVKYGKKRRKNYGYVQQFVCNRGILYRQSQQKKGEPYRKTTYNHNRKNGRGADGVKMSRQITTLRPQGTKISHKKNRLWYIFRWEILP